MARFLVLNTFRLGLTTVKAGTVLDTTKGDPTPPFDGGTTIAMSAALEPIAADAQRLLSAGSIDGTAVATYVLSRILSGETSEEADSAIADWGSAGSVRFYAVDYDAGDDANLGYSDTSAADAGTKAVKTLERLRAIVPRFGNGRKLVMFGARRDSGGVGSTYRNAADTADDDLFLDNLVGYQGVWVRGTATDATAGCTKFADDAADRIFAGARQVTGTNAAGYKATGSPTVSVFDCLTFAGGAPGLAAEPNLQGMRIRFDAATPTVALRNVCRMIHTNDTDTITVSDDLPAVPATGGSPDVFYIEEPGFACGKVVSKTIGSIGPSGSIGGTIFVGVRSVDIAASTGFALAGGSYGICFCAYASAGTLAATYFGTDAMQAFSGYTAHDLVFVTCGSSFRGVGSFSLFGCRAPFYQQFAIVGSGRRLIIDGMVGQSFNLGGGSYCGGISLQGSLFASIGNIGSLTQRVLRCEGPGSGSRVISLSVSGNNAAFLLDGIQIQNAGASYLIRLGQAYCCGVRLKNITGSVGNTGGGLTVNEATVAGCDIVIDTGVTVTVLAGNEIVGNGDIRHAFADVALTDFYDKAGNHYGPNVRPDNGFGSFVNQGKALDNDGTTTLVQWGVAKLGTLGGQYRMAIGDTAANAANVIGVRQNLGGASSIITCSGYTWIEFDAAPTLGNLAYLGVTTAGKARDTTPPVSGTNQKLRLGRILQVSGTKGLVAWNPDPFPVLADGLA